MYNLDETKVKDLLRGIVKDIFDCLPENEYTKAEKNSIEHRIATADLTEGLLTNRSACATVKHQKVQDQLNKKFTESKE